MKFIVSFKAALLVGFGLISIGLVTNAEAQSSEVCPAGQDACSGIVDDTLRNCCRDGLTFVECSDRTEGKWGTIPCRWELYSGWESTNLIDRWGTRLRDLNDCCVQDPDSPQGTPLIESCFLPSACQASPVPALSITKTGDKTDVTLSEGSSQPEVNFTITVLNTGIGVAKDVVIKDILPTAYDAPKGFTLASFDCGYGGVPSRTIDAAATCSYDAIGSAEIRSVRVTMKVDPETKCDSTLVNSATVALKPSPKTLLGTAKADVHVTCPTPTPASAPELQPQPAPEPAPQPQAETEPTPETAPAPETAPTPAPTPTPTPTPAPTRAPAPVLPPAAPEAPAPRFKAVCTSAPENIVKANGKDYIFAIGSRGGPVQATIGLVFEDNSTVLTGIETVTRYLAKAGPIRLIQNSGPLAWGIVKNSNAKPGALTYGNALNEPSEIASLPSGDGEGLDVRFTVVPTIPNEPEETSFTLVAGEDSYEVSCLTIVGIQGGGCALVPEGTNESDVSGVMQILLAMQLMLIAKKVLKRCN